MHKNFDITLTANEIPTKWYNFRYLLADKLPNSLNYNSDVCSSQTDIMSAIRPKALLNQDKSTNEWIDIPEEILTNLIKIGRPTPLRRAVNLEKYLDTPAKIYFKREDVLTTGSFKLTTAIAQAYYCKNEGYTGVISETGAGQWGMALALASKFYDLDCKLFMSNCSLKQKPYRKIYSSLLGADLSSSPSIDTKIGRNLLAKHPNHPGSIGTAISDAIEKCLELDNFAYLSGSNTPHVLIHQSLLGLEVQKQFDKISESPDELIACVSGGSNFGGLILPYLKSKLENNNIRFIGAESNAAPRLTEGIYEYDNSDFAGYTPKVKSYTMGHDFIPSENHVGGLRQHNGSPIIGYLKNNNIIEAQAHDEVTAFKAAQVFLETEGILVAPESSHAVATAINSALECKKNNQKKNIVFLCSGNGLLDLEGYNEVLL